MDNKKKKNSKQAYTRGEWHKKELQELDCTKMTTAGRNQHVQPFGERIRTSANKAISEN